MGTATAYPVRTPHWVLTYSGTNITTDVSGMVTELSYCDKAVHYSDEVEVALEDRDRRWQGAWFPGRGDIVSLMLGYDDEQLLPCGSFQVDELELNGPPDTFHLRCIAAGITPSVRTHRSAAYESQTLLQLAATIAARHGMSLVGAPQDVNVLWSRLTQRNETDLHFLHRLAQAHNYDFSIRGTHIIFYARAALEAQPSVMTITRGSPPVSGSVGSWVPQNNGREAVVKSFEFKTRTQHIYKTATVVYQNPQQKMLIAAQFEDSSSPTGDDLYLVERCENSQQAQLKAKSALHDANRLQVTGTIATEGTTLLVAGNNIALRGFGAFDGTFHIEESKHRLNRSRGYTTEIEVRRIC
ncbi:MAG TPA: hypothetical protein VJ728_11625 [Candidatus Binataceae bacterium]|nr:hypothetical protein [Candidatus Binataceae bacterium]